MNEVQTTELRGPDSPGRPRVPSMAGVVLLVAVSMALLVLTTLVLTFFGNRFPLSWLDSNLARVAAIELAGVGLPVTVFLWRGRFDLCGTLGLRRCGLLCLTGSLLMGAAAVVLGAQMEWWQSWLLPPPEEYLEALDELMSVGPSESMVKVLLVLALLPAVCEEVLFRGIVLRALAVRWKRPALIVGIGLIFALFHLDPYRAPVLALFGMLLTWTALEAGSLWPAVVFHLANNAFSLVLFNLDQAGSQEWLGEVGQVPSGLFAVSAGAIVLGAYLLKIGSVEKREKFETPGQ